MEDYNLPTTLSRKEELLQSELNRIRQTASFKFGNHFVRALERPWMIPLLPFTIPLLMFKILRDGKGTNNVVERSTRHCVVLFSCASVRGLHFDRIEALIGKMDDPKLQIIHVTTDDMFVTSTRKNVHYYMFPERAKLDGMNPKLWNTQCEIFLNSIFDIYSPKTFIFDGDYPFRGMLNAMESRAEMNRFWLRESSLNYKISSLPSDAFEMFDAIIHPTLQKKTDPDTNIGRSGSIFCNPILSTLPEKSQAELFRKKEIPDGGQLIFFDVGKREDLAEKIGLELLSNEDVHLLVRENMRIKSVLNHPRTLSRSRLTYSEALSVCDAAVIYPDHFSVHTTFFTRTPALSIFEEGKTIRDLQEEFGGQDIPLLYLDSSTDDGIIQSSVKRLIDKNQQLQLIERMEQFGFNDDTTSLTQLIMKHHV